VARTLALDLGKARIGVAIDDELGSMAHGRGVLDARDSAALVERLRELVSDEGVERIVVGLPVDMRGHEGDAARQARALAQVIADGTGVTVELWDERMTTMVAARALSASGVRGRKAKARVDEVAAVAILESWLEARRARPRRG
jgi:putative Holliday junction resolvase